MCGDNPQCSQKHQEVVNIANGDSDCDSSKCSYTSSIVPQRGVVYSCKVQRGPEVCEKITKYYNPLYAGNAGKVNTDGTPLDTACDDEKGKYLGTYQCLGNTMNIPTHRFISKCIKFFL